ncbi:MAG TPA: hypothetical protein VMI10_01955 [Terriglobales bacterium]|nr:hypothetical protein [Terriglobales bacterium]
MPQTNQRDRVLAALRAAGGKWVPAPELAKISLQYGARLFELRRLGHRIENEIDVVDGSRHSRFRLVAPRSAISQPLNGPQKAAGSELFPLFPSGGVPERHRDE